jgi:hypothetical protein
MKTWAFYSPRVVEGDSLFCQQVPLHFQTALVATEGTIGSNSTMARHDERKGIVCQRVTYGACSAGHPQMRGDKFVRADAASRDCMLSAENPSLKLTTRVEICNVEREVDRLPIQ